jgi:hypothetical protein
VEPPYLVGLRVAPSKNKWQFFAFVFSGFLTHGFSNSIKELRLLANPCQWIIGIGCYGILYMYFFVNNEDI